MLQPLVLMGLALAVPVIGDGVTPPNWMKASYYSEKFPEIHYLDEFLLCAGWKKRDIKHKGPFMRLNLLLDENGKPGIHIFIFDKVHAIPSFEFGKEFDDTLISGKKAKTTINASTSEEKLLVEIVQKMEDGGVLTHQLEIIVAEEPEEKARNTQSFAVRAQSNCNNQVEIFTGWYPSR